MAEGHVVRYNAERFHALLAGKPVVRAFWRSRRVPVPPERVVGLRVAAVRFAGKNHLFDLEDGSTFRVHLMMFGSTQAGPPHLALRKPESRVRFLLEVLDARVVVFSAPIVEWYPPGAGIPAVAALGPDALKDPFDGRAFQHQLRVAPHATVAEALLNPGVVAGVGNVYKSEILWQARIHPERAPASLTAPERRELARLTPLVMLEAYEALRAHEPMHQHRRVYRRSGQPCLRCGATLAFRQVGGRRTFWCPACQPAPASPAPPAPPRTLSSRPRRAAGPASAPSPRRPPAPRRGAKRASGAGAPPAGRASPRGPGGTSARRQ